jgi:type II secretory pathway component PulF
VRSCPLDFLELWSVGEESGDLDKASEKLAQIYMEKAQFRFELISQWVPKLLYFAVIIFMGIQIIRAFMTIYGGITDNFLGDF